MMASSDGVTDIVEIDISKDGDVCNQNELNSLYTQPYFCSARKAVGLEKLYILHLDCQWKSDKLATALSNNSIHITSATTLEKVATFIAHDESLVDVRFSPADPDLLFSASNGGDIRLWDVRTTQKPVQEFKGDPMQRPKPLLTFDVSCDGKVICGGTEKIKHDSFLMFWDTRSSNILKEHTDFHEDDISHVQFHPTKSHKLATCSTDALINIFDVTQDEDETLEFSLNTETSCGRLQWLPHNKVAKQESISVITHTEGVQMWDIEEAAPKYSFDRQKITDALKRKNSETCYAIRCFDMGDGNEPLLLAGSNTPNKGCLRLLKMVDGELKPYAILYDNKGGNSQTIRSAALNRTSGQIITGGEDGIINIWMPGEDKPISVTNPMVEIPSKKAQKNRSTAKKPYAK